MASVPMSSSGNLAGLGVVGSNVNSDRIDTPQPNESCPTNFEPLSIDVPSREHVLPAPTRSDSKTARGVEFSHEQAASDEQEQCPPVSPLNLHRIREVREQQGISVRSMSKRLGMDAKRYRQLEDSQSDLTLSELHAVQKALEVPFADLLEDHEALSRPVEERAKMVKAMKTAVALRECKTSPRVERMARMLCEQLVDLMPELEDVSGWPQFGARRGQSALGKALRQPIDTSQLGHTD